jgi:peptide/nickel transport system permease protein
VPPLLTFILRRLLILPVTFLIVTALLYMPVMLIPVQDRIDMYVMEPFSLRTAERSLELQNVDILRRYKFDQPYHIQYTFWLGQLLSGQWGFSPNLREYVSTALLVRTPATLELLLYSTLLYLPMGLLSGVIAAWQQGRRADGVLRFGAFLGTSIPSFIVAFVMLGVFYIGLRWFAPGRIDPGLARYLTSEGYHAVTGMITVDSVISGRWDMFWSAWRHLAMPIVTLAFIQWATVMRLMRVSTLETLQTEYITAAKARGVSLQRQLWHHAFRNALVPVLTNSMMTMATLISNLFIIERIFNYPGLSDIIGKAFLFSTPDVALMLGFAVYSILLVLPMVFLMELLQALIDPRIREGVTV